MVHKNVFPTIFSSGGELAFAFFMNKKFKQFALLTATCRDLATSSVELSTRNAGKHEATRQITIHLLSTDLHPKNGARSAMPQQFVDSTLRVRYTFSALEPIAIPWSTSEA